MPQTVLRAFEPRDAAAVNAIAVSAFEQYRAHYTDWSGFANKLAHAALLANQGELIVAEANGRIAGAVAYIGPGLPKSVIFEQAWPIMRMLVVSPDVRGHGLGCLLAQECIRRAQRDNAEVFALHTTPIHGVPYGIYLKVLGAA